MAEWFVEGVLDRLLDTHDALSRRLRTEATFYIVPNMNPDGSFRGYLRVNAAGCNLNREWTDSGEDYKAPTLERSPEVYYITQESARTGCDFFIDAHGDESIPHNFVTSMEANPKWNARLEGLQNEFKDYWTKVITVYNMLCILI
jgi:murein tripeptide amidase MpaA